MGNDSTVLLEQSDSIAVLTLTSPYSLNIAGKHELLNTLHQLAKQENLRALIVASGHFSFCNESICYFKSSKCDRT